MISDDLIKVVVSLNEKLENRKNIVSLKADYVKTVIQDKIGKIKTYKRISNDMLNAIKQKGNICVVDGSVNKIGTNYPHYIEFFQAMALLNTIDEPIVETRTICPLVDDFLEDEQVKQSKKTLCETELDCAIRALNYEISYLIMDGNLLRYDIECHDKFIELVNLCENKNVVLVGIVEEIDTKIVMNTLKSLGKDIGIIFDREALFNVLDLNEGFIVESNKSMKEERDIEQAFLRSSKDPCVIAIDIMSKDFDIFDDIISLILTLSDENTRGIPFILDMVDKKTRIDNKAVEILIKQYLDSDVFESLFRAQRSKRVI